MAQEKTSIALMMVLVTVLWTGSTAQTDCTNTLISLSPCLSYITGNSSKPDSGCCTQLSSVVRSRPECLCQALNGGGSSLGVQVNQTQAQALPSVCNVQTPPLSSCNSGSPTGSPTPSGPGSNTSPSTDSGSSDGSSTKLAMPLLFFLLFVASYASTVTI